MKYSEAVLPVVGFYKPFHTRRHLILRIMCCIFFITNTIQVPSYKTMLFVINEELVEHFCKTIFPLSLEMASVPLCTYRFWKVIHPISKIMTLPSLSIAIFSAWNSFLIRHAVPYLFWLLFTILLNPEVINLQSLKVSSSILDSWRWRTSI